MNKGRGGSREGLPSGQEQWEKEDGEATGSSSGDDWSHHNIDRLAAQMQVLTAKELQPPFF